MSDLSCMASDLGFNQLLRDNIRHYLPHLSRELSVLTLDPGGNLFWTTFGLDLDTDLFFSFGQRL